MTTLGGEMLTRAGTAAPAGFEVPSSPLSPPSARALRRTRIQAAPRWPTPNLREVWAARGLLLFLVWRDVKVRYAQTVLGASWAVLQPVATMVVFTVIFGRFARIPSGGVPYAVFSLTALVAWSYFAGALSGASNSLLSNLGLVTKVYCPRLVIPLSAVFAGLLDFVIAFSILLVAIAGAGIVPSPWAILVVPVSLLAVMMTAAGVGCFLAAINIQYRDVKQITPFLVQLWMYGSPIVYPLSLVPAKYRALYAFNPMTGVVEGLRAATLGTGPIPAALMVASVAVSAVLLACGTLYFRHVERVFADVA